VAKFSWVRRLLLNDRDSARLAANRAELEFHRAGIGRTENKTGILLFLALEDHEAVVLADHGISSKLPPETWSDVVSLMLNGIKKKDLASGLSSAVTRCGDILSKHFPVSSTDRNELSNHLIISSY
jgi:putative membrane protein